MRARHAFTPVSLALGLSYLAGCSRLGTDLVRQGSVQLHVQESKHVGFSGVTVRQDNEGNVEISGTVRARLGGQRPIASVHVQVVDAARRSIIQATGKLRGQSPSIRQRYASTFRIKIPDWPRHAAKVLVRYGSAEPESL